MNDAVAAARVAPIPDNVTADEYAALISAQAGVDEPTWLFEELLRTVGHLRELRRRYGGVDAVTMRVVDLIATQAEALAEFHRR